MKQRKTKVGQKLQATTIQAYYKMEIPRWRISYEQR